MTLVDLANLTQRAVVWSEQKLSAWQWAMVQTETTALLLTDQAAMRLPGAHSGMDSGEVVFLLST